MSEKLINFFSIFSVVFMFSSLALLFWGDDLERYINFKTENQKATVAEAVKKEVKENIDPLKETLKELEEAKKENSSSTKEEKIDTLDWKIHYGTLVDKNIYAYSFKYPRNWNIYEQNDSLVLTYEFGGKIYTIVFTDLDVDVKDYDSSTTSSTTLAEMSFDKTYYLKDNATSAIQYLPEGSIFPFLKIVAYLPKQKAQYFDKVIDTIISSFDIELARKPFRIVSLFVPTQTVVLKSKTSFPTKLSYKWAVRPLRKLNHMYIETTIEDKDGNILYYLKPIRSLEENKKSVELPPLCEAGTLNGKCFNRKEVLGKPFFVVMRGFSCRVPGYKDYDCPDEMKDYADSKKSNAFFFDAPIEFANPSIKVSFDKQKGIHRIDVSVINNSALYGFILAFDNGKWAKLEKKEGNLYAGTWYKNLDGISKIYLVRVEKPTLDSQLYGFKTLKEILSVGQVVYELNLNK